MCPLAVMVVYPVVFVSTLLNCGYANEYQIID